METQRRTHTHGDRHTCTLTSQILRLMMEITAGWNIRTSMTALGTRTSVIDFKLGSCDHVWDHMQGPQWSGKEAGPTLCLQDPAAEEAALAG